MTNEQCTQMMDGMMDGNMMSMMGGMMGGNMMGGGMMGGMMLMMLLGTVLFVALLIAGIVLLVRFLRGGTGGSGSEALNILQARFANGEIDREEYQERRMTLQRQR